MNASTVELTRDMLTNPIDIRTSQEVDFDDAKRMADAKAREKLSEPMPLAWYDRKAGTFAPKVECCDQNKPAWLIYAESRGGKVVVSVNGEEYVFVYRESQ
jgi:hypothetical protein